MSSWDGKSKGNVLGYKFFVWVLQYAGLGTTYFILKFAAFYYFLFSLKTFSVLFYYFRKRLGFGLLKSVFSIYRNYYIFGQTLVDKVCIIAGFKNTISYSFEGEEYLHQMAESKGGFLISAHVGNYEFAGHALSLKTKVNVVLFEGEHAKIKKYLSGVQKASNFNVIVVNNHSFEHIYKINEAIEKKELVCIHGDRFAPGSKIISCKLLGEEAMFPLGPFLLVAQLQVPVSFVFAVKKSNYRYHFSATKPISCDFHPNRQQRDREVLKVVNKYVEALENVIHKFPEQWFNYYHFWRTSNGK
jgi:predicted LPLAT superfamily acyltransferase